MNAKKAIGILRAVQAGVTPEGNGRMEEGMRMNQLTGQRNGAVADEVFCDLKGRRSMPATSAFVRKKKKT